MPEQSPCRTPPAIMWTDLDRRGTVPEAEPAAPVDIVFRNLQLGEDTAPFRMLNEEWISRYFVLEAKDRAVLGDPENAILREGGHILQAWRADEVVGCVALIPMGDGVFELSKMAVSPSHRGVGIGRRLLEHAIAQARALGIASLFLGSNSVLANAVHLYESVGFCHIPADQIPPTPYTRANVFMRMTL